MLQSASALQIFAVEADCCPTDRPQGTGESTQMDQVAERVQRIRVRNVVLP